MTRPFARPSARRLFLAMVLLLGTTLSARSQSASPTTAPALDVLNYEATVEPNSTDKTVTGRVSIEFRLTPRTLDAVEFDIGGLTVDSVNENGASLEFTQRDRRLRVSLNAPGARAASRRIDVAYHGAPKFGLTFSSDKSQIYTIFSTDQWMPCINWPGDRATLSLTIVVMKGLTVIANGRLVAAKPMPDGRVAHEWRLDRPAPTFTFGFAAAKFNEVLDTHGKTKLRYLSTTLTGADLQRPFTETGDMIAFFENHSGVPYSHASYIQGLVEETVGQEMSGFSLMSDAYAGEVLSDPQRVGLIAHELAHQWWGIGLTCEDWTHFWLNEGFATFMAAAFREKRFGREVYLKDVAGWRARYDKIRAAGGDKSLVFAAWNRPTSDDRALVYQKGALVLHELRLALGDSAFWKGLRDYTKSTFGKSVVTRDFQAAMEKSSKRDLHAFFDQWVYVATPTSN